MRLARAIPHFLANGGRSSWGRGRAPQARLRPRGERRSVALQVRAAAVAPPSVAARVYMRTPASVPA
eukprot:4017284-Pyramimonas_sp.AAC.1